LPFDRKSRETKKKVALRSRAIFLATGLLGVFVFPAAPLDSVAADTAKTNGTKTIDVATNDAKAISANTDRVAGDATEKAGSEADAPDKPPGDAVGTIEGDAIALQGPMSVEVVHGQVKTMLRSGNDIRVKSGQARIDLVEGGTIAICGPAHLSLLKSGGSLTIAIDSGIVHVHVGKTPSLTLYTAQVQAKPIAIGDDDQDALIGFDAAGVMCVRAGSGAIRIEQQLSGKSVIVPQGAEILVDNGGLEGITNTSGHCECELQVSSAPPPGPEVSRMATPDEIRQRDAAKAAEAAAIKEAADNAAMDKAAAEKEAADRAAAQRAAAEKAAADKLAADNAASAQAEAARAAAAQAAAQAAAKQAPTPTASAQNNAKPPVPWGENASPQAEQKVSPQGEQKVVRPELPKNQEPVYQVFMPPLSYSAKADAPPDNFDPKFIMLVRRVRVKPTLIYQGRVEGETPVAKPVSDVRPVSTTAKVGPVQPPNGNAAPQGAQQNAKPAPPPDNSVVNRVRNYIRHLFS
jgi:hypothetical protein